MIRGMDHVGITVPDLESASRFLVEAFGAIALYDNMTRKKPPFAGPEAEATLGLEAGGAVIAMRMLKLGFGPGIELFEIRAPDQHPPARASDFGLQHFALYVDDIEAATRRFTEAGGTLLTRPRAQLGIEEGEGNTFCYGRTPWGMTVEFLSTPNTRTIDAQSPTPRYQPPRT
ncbi:Glyoxalase/bleomycin resistance protein/dioxygenase [Gluconacetobacter diazotrophicus PA1 5]|uniref:Glyoxalase/bleomycin resistance/dioxygenase family protein n=2 Tax=Gluconacetobacter diazotrophicus TaxID=33996 RepID=A0A7W4I5Z8_GLUDI|nr:VOC family protein [Gluconacetobacter diazotrophicus]ACI52131.1 Glyoxalase/bleomycin resistance protein/dioxygenase [Gluconacetobacter diazotrophicus PA1 5]MBB2156894.1 glyoxalase/bleomycin resistance/dioxygenase family protein [Gluconacetobacter diazotrophicus]TWB01017.1 catechol 2,3-dioxygenase-like lactoylglutathione lyase family enzyme [Gluconacetobacter diazotrophicus]CAP54266.1 putative glyoxalase [Gluconacetobacter diazotrophicus PA1 5]